MLVPSHSTILRNKAASEAAITRVYGSDLLEQLFAFLSPSTDLNYTSAGYFNKICLLLISGREANVRLQAASLLIAGLPLTYTSCLAAGLFIGEPAYNR